jgi:hypothetical protein
MSKMQPADAIIRTDPPLPPLDTPDPVTIHDLTAEQRSNIIITGNPGHPRKWEWKPGFGPK